MIKSIVLILSSLILTTNAFAQSNIKYRTSATGDWSNPGIWQTSENGGNWTSAINAPNQQASSIEIRAPHKVTITTLVVADQLLVAADAELHIGASGILLVSNHASVVDMRIQGMVINEGTFLPINGGLLSFEDQASFVHHRNGGVIPAAQWSQTATLQINAVSDLPVTGLDQRFGTLIWNSANKVTVPLNSTQIQGSLIIQNGHPTHPFWLRPSSGTLYIAGDLIISDPAYVVFGGDSPQALRIQGQMQLSGGVFEFTGQGQQHDLITLGDCLLQGGHLRTQQNALAQFSFTNPLGHLLQTGTTISGNIRYEVKPGALLRFNEATTVLEGQSFRLSDEARIELLAPIGLSQTAATGHIQTRERFFSEKAQYTYAGQTRQHSGDGLPNRVQSLTVRNPEGLALSGERTIMVSDSLVLASGSLLTMNATIALEKAAVLRGADEDTYIIGTLQRGYGEGEQRSLMFPIGDALRYSPLTVTLNKVVGEGKLSASTRVLPEVPRLSSGALATHYVDRQWNVSGTSTPFESYTLQVSYTQDEIVGHYLPDSIWVREFVNGTWNIVTQIFSIDQTLEIGPLTRFNALMLGWEGDTPTTNDDDLGISGFLFEDENANGFADSEDAPRAGITVELRSPAFTILSTTRTNSNGWFNFPDVVPGTYKIVVRVPENRRLSNAASSAITVEVPSTGSLTRLEIGLYEPLHLEGKIDLGPPNDRYTSESIVMKGYFRGYFGQPAELPNQIREDETPAFIDTLAADGSYHISGIRPGHYLLQLALPPYWTLTVPNPQRIEVKKNAISSLTFAPQLDEQRAPLRTNGGISGLVFEEILQLGSRQAELEPAMAEVTLTLRGTDVRGARIERTTRTDRDGNYRFEQLPEGFYRVQVQADKPYQATFPESGRHGLYIKGNEKIGHAMKAMSIPMANSGTYPIYGYLRIGLDTTMNNRINAFLTLSGQGNIALHAMNGSSRTLKLIDFTAMEQDSSGVRTSIQLPGLKESSGMWQSGTMHLTSGMELNHKNKTYQVTDAISLSGFIPAWPLQHTVLVHYPTPGLPIINPFGEKIAQLQSIEFVAMSGLDFGLFDLRNLDSVIIAKKIPEQPTISQETLPREISLGQNYPNPFNPSTIIPFALPVSMPVKLQVYDVTGRLLQVLLNETKPAGTHEITFKAGDLPSGVYFVILEAGGKVFTKKISLLK